MVLSLGEITPVKENIPSLFLHQHYCNSLMPSLRQENLWDLSEPIFRNITHILPSE